MRRILLTLVAITFLGFGAAAQNGKLKKADNYYNLIAYSQAAEIYTDLIGSEVDTPTMKGKLANCYYEMGETKKAAEIYSQMIDSPEATAEDYYRYASSLRENGNYNLSNTWMDKFHEKNAADSRAQEFEDNKNFISDIKAQGNYFSINHLQINTDADEFGGYPVADKRAYIVSNRKKRFGIKRFYTWNDRKFLDLYYADIKEDQEFENLEFQSRATNTKYHEGPMCLSNDGKTIYFTRNNIKRGKKKSDEGIQNLKIYRAYMDSEDDWDEEEELPFNSKEYSVGHPALSPDGKWLYFTSDMPGGMGGADIWKVEVKADGSFGNPKNLGEKINTEGQEMFPWLDENGLIFFASDGHLGLGGLDVFVAITNEEMAIKKVMNVGEPVNGPKDDFALVMNADATTGYFSSNRETGSGGDDIYSFNLLKTFKVNLMLKGVVTEKGSGNILPGATVNLKDAEGNLVATTVADNAGAYEFELEPKNEYALEGTKEKYFDDMGKVSTNNLPDGTELIEEDLTLEKDPGIALYALVMDAKSNEPIEGVKMIIIDNFTGEEFANTSTPSTGDFLKGLAGKKLEDRISYNISLQKEGYFPKSVTFNHKITKPGVINVHDLLEGGLSMDKEVTDLSQLVQINPINFDLNKYKIRPDAEVELNKIVTVMNKYPGMVVELGSHTDCRASKRYNETLSDKRAKASAAYIKSQITKPERIYGKGYGEVKLLNDCFCEGKVKSTCTEEEHEINRRTEFKVIEIGNPDLKVINTSTDSFDGN